MTHVRLRRTAAAIVAGILISACSTATRHVPTFVVPNQPSSPFSPVVRVEHMLYLSGQIGADSAGHLSGNTARETALAMEHIRSLLERAGSSLDRVAKCTVMLADMNDWAAMNQVYDGFFPNHRPARSSFGASGLALGAKVEIECIATVD